MVTIAIDAMGGDYAPTEVIKGVELARDQTSDVQFLLFGDKDQLRPLIKDDSRISLTQSQNDIEMGDEPVKAVKHKKQASLVLAAQAVKEGKANALFSAGNTGAVLVAGLLIIGRIAGIDRPGLTTTLPSVINNVGFTLIDCGANADAKVLNVYQYSLLGKYYAQKVLGIENPRVGLINNGTEPDKGNRIHQKMYQALAENPDINFIGNIESRELLNDVTDVAVSDGFTGNAVLKSIEGTAISMMRMLKDGVVNGGIRSKAGALLLKPVLEKIAHKLDYTRYGGAVLMGLRAPVVKAHGSSKAKTVRNTIMQIRSIVNSGLNGSVQEYFKTHKDEINALKNK